MLPPTPRLMMRTKNLVITSAEEPITLQSLMRGYSGPKPESIDIGAFMGREACWQ